MAALMERYELPLTYTTAHCPSDLSTWGSTAAPLTADDFGYKGVQFVTWDQVREIEPPTVQGQRWRRVYQPRTKPPGVSEQEMKHMQERIHLELGMRAALTLGSWEIVGFDSSSSTNVDPGTYTYASSSTNDGVWHTWNEALEQLEPLAVPEPAIAVPTVTPEEAGMKAEALLISTLNPKQVAEYQKTKAVTIQVSDRRTFRFRKGRVKNVDVLGPDGRVQERLCVHIGQRVPNEDNMLAQILFAQKDPEAFIRMANRYRVV